MSICSSPKTMGNECFPVRWEILPNDGLLAVDSASNIDIWTGPDFGCVNFQRRESD